jgi:hypothetical protein
VSLRYYLQENPRSLRVYNGASSGKRWEKGKWVDNCASERSCLLTGDKVVSKDEAESFIKGAM